MRALDRKMLRDLWHLKGQALAIAAVIACGVAIFIMLLSTLDSLRLTRAMFYQDHRFADVFASVHRAPISVQARLTEIPGVQDVETRVVASANLDVIGFDEPVSSLMVSIPDNGEQLHNKLYLRSGRLPASGRDDEVLISESFALAHEFQTGDVLYAIINGKRKKLSITGTAISPEYIYQLQPGSAWPDYARYGILWMNQQALAAAFDMEGAFNNITLRLSRDAQEAEVIDRLDEILAPYGGVGAYGRDDQLSNNFLNEEFKSLQQTSSMFPTIFLGVAVFLLNVVIGRLVTTQREQIAALKAFGYRNRDIGSHFLKLMLLIVALGMAIGIGLGAWLGKGMGNLYMIYFKFPYLIYDLQTSVILSAIGANLGAALLGTLFAVRKGVSLQPAEAMRPAPPTVYRQTWLERLGIGRWLSPPNRMILRHIERRPVKSTLTVIGIAFACGINMTGQFQGDTVGYMMDLHYNIAQRQDLTLTFTDPTSLQARHNLQGMPGVEHVEVFRAVPVKLIHGHREHRTAILGIEDHSDLRQLLDADLNPIPLPQSGIVLTDFLGQMLNLKVGDTVHVELLEGRRTVEQLPVVGLVKEYLGVSAYMHIDAVNRLMREGHAISGAYLAIDPAQQTDIFHQLKQTPRIATTVQRQHEIDNFNKTMDQTMIFITMISTFFAAIICFGVVYNSARIALTERSRELASLRVLGFTRGEISYILLGELAILTAAAIPLGLWIGYALCGMIASELQSELYRVPVIINASTYTYAAIVVVIASLLSGLLVRRQLDKLDLIGALKTKE